MKKVIPGKVKTQLRLDGYYNVLNKYGTQHDSTEYYQWASGTAVSDAELADLYAGNGLFATIIDAPADDATKNGIDLGIKDKDLQKQLDDRLQTIHYQSKLSKALRWARLFGGAAVVILVDDGRLLQEPLNWRDVHGVDELLVYGRNEMLPLWINGYENNPDDEDYRKGGTGIPEYYQVNSVYGNYTVHSSRCLIFHNSDIPEGSTLANLYRTWGIPEYMRIREELRNASIGPGYSIRLLERLSMAIYKMKNLANVLSTADGEDAVLQRMEMIDLARNLLNMVFIDADGEDLGIQSLSVAGVKDILDNACAMLSAVSHIPQTRLFGRSPAGENATGESDLENYKEFVGGIQSGDLRDNTRTLVELVLRGMVWSGEIKEVPEYTVTYKSAWSPSDDEKATQDQAVAAAQLTRAQTASTYVTNGILESAEVRRALVQDEQFDPENILTETDLNQEQDWGLTDARGQIPTSGDFSRQENPIVTDEGDCGYVAGFVLNDGRILCGRRSDGQGWCGPGGHIEPGETPSVAFRREAKEEFNIDVGGITYLGNCKGKPDEVLPVQIYRVNAYDGVPRCDQEEMFTATWMPPEQILAQDVPGGLVFEPFRRSVEEYIDQLGLTLDDFDSSKHKRDEAGKFTSSGGSSSSKSEKSSVTKQEKSDTIKSQPDDVPPSVAKILKARDAKAKKKTKYAPSKQRQASKVKMSPKKYAQVCGIYMTRYPGLKPEDGPRQAFDANNIYRAQADGYGGSDVQTRLKISYAAKKKKPK
nr:MAG TPA: Portal [Caudoviricetes sp.]